MSALEEYYQITRQAIEGLSDHSWYEDRDAAIAALDKLIEVRETLQQRIKPPFTAEEKGIGEACIQLNEELNRLMVKRRMEVARDIQNVKKQRKTNDKYVNPYDSIVTDGVFYDKRK